MNTTAWLDQRAAAIRNNREGHPVPNHIKQRAEMIAEQFPDLDRQTIGAVLIACGAMLTDTWAHLENLGATVHEIPEALLGLTEIAGEYLYAPEGGVS